MKLETTAPINDTAWVTDVVNEPFSFPSCVEIYRLTDSPTPSVQIAATGKDRRYRVILSPEEVVKCLLCLPEESIADAVAAVVASAMRFPPPSRVDLLPRFPEVVKQLTAGAMLASRNE